MLSRSRTPYVFRGRRFSTLILRRHSIMAWDEERVELLKKLWSEGLSASQIAGRLGGVTRNAVIGKVHRLGLSGRATTSRIKSVRPRKRASGVVRSPRMKYFGNGSGGSKPDFDGGAGDPMQAFSHVEELVIPLEERVSLVDLKECNCRWPIGDPTHEDFHFCGRNKVPGSPYCEHHANVAFQPARSRRRPSRQKVEAEPQVALKAQA